MMEFFIFKDGIRYTVRTDSGFWHFSRLFIGYNRTEVVRELKRIARARFNLKRARFTVYV